MAMIAAELMPEWEMVSKPGWELVISGQCGDGGSCTRNQIEVAMIRFMLLR